MAGKAPEIGLEQDGAVCRWSRHGYGVDDVSVVDDDGELVAGMIGLVGTAVLAIGIAVGPGTASKVLMPRLLISVDPGGIPTPRLEPLAVDIGVDDAAGFVAPEPHMLERPEVSIMAVVVGIAEPDIAPDVAMPVGALGVSESPPPS
jgi:hypothetical protein